MVPRFGLRTAFVAVTAIAIYVGAYCALLEPISVVDVGNLGMVIEGSREPHYRTINNVCRFVFAPIEWIDYRLRPNYWSYADDWPSP
jgi:hypothetical protein